MARDHFMLPTVPTDEISTVRLGAGNAEAQRVDYKEVGKFVKLAGESRYDLAAVGNEIEGSIYSVELAPQNGFSIASISTKGRLFVIFDGLQGTPGTGVVALGDYVVTGTPVAKATALTTYPKVCKATAAGNTLNFKWRVISLGSVGTGAVGTVGVIEFIG